jgi:hypothetical protein
MKSAIFTLVTSLVVFFTPIAPLMLIVAAFIAADTLIGISKAVIKKQGFYKSQTKQANF